MLFIVQENFQGIVDLLQGLEEDLSIPKNVRVSIVKAKTALTTKTDVNEALSGCIYGLDEIVNDVNLPMHARTIIWNILSELESLK
ncbi:Uncharacterised protein [uncultured archaeon]|nr:Uncharacterised protein [uncultured archaeon]